MVPILHDLIHYNVKANYWAATSKHKSIVVMLHHTAAWIHRMGRKLAVTLALRVYSVTPKPE